MTRYDAVAYIGRFQPLHTGHWQQILHAIGQVKPLNGEVVVCLGSTQESRTKRNPWTAEERERFILASLPWPNMSRFIRFAHLIDMPGRDPEWVEQVRGHIRIGDRKVALVGFDKDATTFYLKYFSDLPLLCAPDRETMNAGDVRASYFTGGDEWEQMVLPGCRDLLDDWRDTEGYEQVAGLYGKES